MCAHQPKRARRPRREQDREHQRTRRARRLGVQRCRTRPATQHAREHGMQVRPKRLRVRQRRVDRRDERGAPQVGRRPAVGLELGGGGQRERGRVEEVGEVGEEDAAVGDELREGVQTALDSGSGLGWDRDRDRDRAEGRRSGANGNERHQQRRSNARTTEDVQRT